MCHYILLRSDLSRGQQVAQCAHAAGESAAGNSIPANTVVVVLAVRDECHLLDLSSRLEEAKIRHILIRECNGSAQAIGIEPTRNRAAIRKLTGSLPLVK